MTAVRFILPFFVTVTKSAKEESSTIVRERKRGREGGRKTERQSDREGGRVRERDIE